MLLMLTWFQKAYIPNTLKQATYQIKNKELK